MKLKFLVSLLIAVPSLAMAQAQPGHPIGNVTVRDKLIVLELDTGVVAQEHLFDLDHRTLRFTPSGSGYRVANVPVVWDAQFGDALPNGPVVLKHFKFPFSGRTWDTLSVQTGTITFGGPATPQRSNVPAGNRTGAGAIGRGGFPVDRFAELRVAAGTIVNTVPGIAAFLKPRMTGERFVKELPDRVVVTWTLTEPSAGIFDFTWVPTTNRIQATLRSNGVIELSYDGVAARDAIVGVYPMITGGTESPIATIADPDDSALAASIDITNVKLASVGGTFVKATIETRGPIVSGDSMPGGRTWRIGFDTKRAPGATAQATAVWTIRAFSGRGPGSAVRYVASGPGVVGDVEVAGNSLSVRGLLPASILGSRTLAVSADATLNGPNGTNAPGDEVAPKAISLGGLQAAEIDLSANSSAVRPLAFESFHYAALPRTTDMACSVIKALGDKFDFFAWYSDFRVDNQEAGTPSTGPRGGDVRGIGSSMRNLDAYCSQGQLQWMFVQPVYIGSAQGQERAPDGRMTDYNYAMSQIGHELGHRWTADAKATVNGETFDLGPVHWARGLQAPAVYPYTKAIEASAMGGGAWKENEDGTFTQLDDDFFVPANGFSWLDLYLMGLARPDEVPPFYLIRNAQPTGNRDAEGHPIYRGTKTPVTIADVVAANGPRLPAQPDAQKNFNTGIVVIVQHGQQPSAALIERANAIREHWMSYWSKTTGGRSVMTTNPR